MNTESPSLTAHFRPHLRQVVLGALLVFISVSLGVLVPFIPRYAIDDLYSGRMTLTRLAFYAVAYVVAALVVGGFAWGMRRVILELSYLIETEIRDRIFTHLTRLDNLYFHRERTGDIMAKMTSDVAAIREFIGQGMLQSVRTVVGFVLAFSVMFYMNARIALVMLLLLPAISIVFFVLLRLIRLRYESVQSQFSLISNFNQETFTGIRTIKGFALESRQMGFFQDLNLEFIRRNLALSAIERPVWPLMAFLFSVGVVLLLLVGGRQVIQGRLSLGEFVQFNQYLFFLQWPMLALGWTSNLFQRGLASWRRVRTILDAQPGITDGDWTNPGLTVLAGDISFRQVTLRMEGRTLLENIHLVIPAGSTVGLTGPTGSGKTLLVSLIARLLEPTLGEVKIGAFDIREYPLEILRRNIGLAPQEPFLFSDTLAKNLAFGVAEDDAEPVLWAADVAQLSPDVELFPGGWQTMLGERGITLSGGQRQRTAIGRALARNPSILILDDVFSAIDTQTEARILEQLRTVIQGRTTILISHRISTLRHCDTIHVLERGRITQSSAHDALVRQPGYYQDLDEIQRLEARLEAG